ncbi:MAG: hypothetical protein GY747_09845 [Planctomycetes bacterium]|nr:hypothetical protein [Planctomycetota bacterium]MCP4771932.1 hypothetical protein [Planctomycetota bacterium]MCP4860417.1 hypothetical protein [Planctomycetota bacterium]
MVSKHLRPLAVLLLLPACSIPGDAAWSDLHASGFVTAYPAGMDATARDVSVEDTSGAGLTFDGDLTMEKNREAALYYGARAGIAPFEVSVSAFGYDGSHSSIVSGGATFRGVDLPITETLNTRTDLDLGVSKLMLGVDIINTPVGRVGLLAGVDFLDFDRFVVTSTEQVDVLGVPIVNDGDTQNILVNESVPVPMIGVRGDLLLPFLDIRLGGELSGLTTNIDQTDVTYLDMDININYAPWQNLELVVGYHRIDIDVSGSIDDTTIDVDMLIDGPYFGASLYW